MQAKTLKDGKMIRFESDIYYNSSSGKMISHYTYPEDYIYITNNIGQATLYYPEKNQVIQENNQMFSSKYSVLYMFLNNKINDMGLSELDFNIENTEFDQDLVITSWLPPAKYLKQISKIKLVHENNLPIFAEYTKNKKVIRKIFYYNYQQTGYTFLPKNITEIQYNTKGDSVINKISITDIKTGTAANNLYFDYKIPDDAETVNN